MKWLGRIAGILFGLFIFVGIAAVVVFAATGQLDQIPTKLDAIPGVQAGSWDESGKNYSEQQSHDVSAIKKISISANACELTVNQGDIPQLTADFKSAATASGKQRFRLSSHVEGDTLYLKVETVRPFSLFNFSFDFDNKLDVVIPKAYTANLDVDLNAGSSSLSDVTLTGEVNFHANAGSAAISNLSCGSFYFDSNATKAELSNLTVAGKASLHGNAGSLNAIGISAKNLAADGNASDIRLSEISSDLTLTGSAGSAHVDFDQVTGDIVLNATATTVTLTIPANSPVWLENRTGTSSHVNDNINWTGNDKHMKDAAYRLSVDGSASTFHLNEK